MNLSFTLYTPAAIKRRRKKPSYEKEGSVEEKKKVFTSLYDSSTELYYLDKTIILKWLKK